ncbi:MAG TPA: Yip1 family protein [Bacillota bacterium]|nr:Yip1 family protein [Bacillota bacterium]
MSNEDNKKKPSLFGMITNPTEQLERLRGRPHIWGALAVVTVLFMFGSWLATLGIEIDYGVDLTPEEEQFAHLFSIITMVAVGFFGPTFSVLILSVIYLIIAKIAQSDVTFKQLFSMNTYIMIISTLGLIINNAIAIFIGSNPEVPITSLGSILNVPGVAGAALESIELFTIWGMIVAVIGLQKVARFSKGLAWGVQIALFIIGMIFAMIGAGIGEMLGG